MAGFLSKGTKIKTYLKKYKNYSELEQIIYFSEINLIEKLKLSNREIKRLLYDVYFINDEDFLKNQYAVIFKGEILNDLPSLRKDIYLIYLNFQKIFSQQSFLKELMLYILTHELVHLVRFIRYETDFYLKNKWEEEKKVHIITKEILKDFKLPYMKEVFSYFDRIYC